VRADLASCLPTRRVEFFGGLGYSRLLDQSSVVPFFPLFSRGLFFGKVRPVTATPLFPFHSSEAFQLPVLSGQSLLGYGETFPPLYSRGG